MSISAKLLSLYFIDSKFNFNLETEGSVQIKVQTNSKLMPPNDPDNKTALLKMRIQITSVGKDNINVDVSTNSIFEFNEVPNDYDDVSQNICIPVAQKEILAKIDNILENMGFPRFNLNLFESQTNT